jgi:propanol-preferring alcohol dehydrogenase
MKAMLLREIVPLTQNPDPLSLTDLPEPTISSGEILIRVTACGVCHTEIDEIEGRMPPPHLPVVLGHQVVGVVEQSSPRNDSNPPTAHEIQIKAGDRVGVAWIYSACGICEFCTTGRENLCPDFKATGRDHNGGYAQYMKAPAEFVHPIPISLSDLETAPLLCAGAIGYRSMKLVNLDNGDSLGLSGFGASAHLVLKMVAYKYPRTRVFAFSRNADEREFARSLGAVWAGAINERPPEPLDAVIDTTPVWAPGIQALKHLKPGGRLVINSIRKEATDKAVLMDLDYPSQLWMEKEIKSVANVTRQDVRQFLALAAEAGIKPEVQEYRFEEANKALVELKQGKIKGAKVLRISG